MQHAIGGEAVDAPQPRALLGVLAPRKEEEQRRPVVPDQPLERVDDPRGLDKDGVVNDARKRFSALDPL